VNKQISQKLVKTYFVFYPKLLQNNKGR